MMTIVGVLLLLITLDLSFTWTVRVWKTLFALTVLEAFAKTICSTKK
jgi:hypothetical protein